MQHNQPLSPDANPTVYWEEQESGFCAVHCINNLLQGAYYTEIDLSQVALKLDEEERRLMSAGGVDTPEYLTFVAADSSNVNLAGNFSIEVIREALRVMSISVLSIGSEEAKAAMEDPLKETAFICHLEDHWLSIRFLHGHWFNLNSLLKHGPELITPFYLREFLAQLRAEGYSIFVVRGNFPIVNRLLDGRGRWFPLRSIVNNSQPSSRRAAAAPPRRQYSGDFDPEMEAAIRASLASTASSSSAPAASASAPSRAPAQADVVDLTGDDAELRAAIAMSVQTDEPSRPSARQGAAAGSAANAAGSAEYDIEDDDLEAALRMSMQQ